jgi:hypothetical protein
MTTVDRFTIDVKIAAALAAGSLAGTVKLNYLNEPARGTALGQVDILIAKDLTGVFGAPISLDLTNILDPAGATVAFVKLTHWGFVNLSDTLGEDFTLWGGANAVFAADPTPVPAKGGSLIRAVPYNGITIDATHKILTFTVAAGAAVPAKIVLAGRSA